MSIDELAASDAAYRALVREHAITETRRGIEIRKAQGGRTVNLERRLAELLAEDGQ